MSSKKNEIISLSDYEHVRLKPTIYIGSINKNEQHIPILNDSGIIEYHNKPFMVGFYKLFLEILDNAIDEAKRCKTMKQISIKLNTKDNSITIQDFGGGFYKGTNINKKTGLNNIKTAMSSLRAGSNFVRDGSDSNLIGTNGVGASIVNMLSSKFSLTTTTKKYSYTCEWENFKIVNETDRPYNSKKDILGTTITFIPDASIFNDEIWDLDIIKFIISTKQFILKHTEPLLQKLKLDFNVNSKKISTKMKLIPDNSVVINTKIGLVALFDPYDKSNSTGFINGARCKGLFQKMIHDKVNSYFDTFTAHRQFYNSMIIMNLHPSLVVFGDQNKTRFESPRKLIDDVISKNFFNKIHKEFVGTPLYKRIKKKVDDSRMTDAIRSIKKSQRESKVKVSNKYTSANKKFDILYICEGLSASGSLLQKRDSNTEGVYSLRGKIMNCRDIRDLSSNQEIIDLMTILDLKLDKDNWKPKYDKIVIATDYDPDGVGHICSLLLNLFTIWFPSVVENGHLYLLETPLVSIQKGNKMEYIYNLNDVDVSNIHGSKRYLKGLGSLTLKDWQFVMNNKKFIQFKKDLKSSKMLDMAFGKDSQKRKNWLRR